MKQAAVLMVSIFSLSLQAGISDVWSHAQASSDAHEGNWKDAQSKISALLVDAPDQKDLLYDAGVAAYKLKEYEKAEAYFSAASESEQNESLVKQALFNLGNSKVALDKLKAAIDAYEKLLALDPDDEKAKHNRDKVKEMLEQQQKEQQQEQQNNQDQNNDSSNQDNQEDSDSSEQNQNEQNDSPQDTKDESEQNQDTQNKESGSEQQSDSSKQNSEQNSNESGEPNEKERSDEQQNWDQENQPTNESDDDNPNQNKDQFGNGHDTSSEKDPQSKESNQSSSQDIEEDDEQQEMQSGQEDPGDYRQEEMEEIENSLPEQRKWMAHWLQKVEDYEEQEQKKMIKVQTYKQSMDQDEQNCW